MFLLLVPLCWLLVEGLGLDNASSPGIDIPPFTDNVSILYQGCPFRSDDEPCECTFKDTGLTVVCNFLQSPQLRPMMDKVRRLNYKVHQFFCFRCRLVLPQNEVFRGLNFSAVHFRESQIDPPPDQSPDSYQAMLGGLELSLVEVYLSDTDIDGLLVGDKCALGTFPALRRFSLAGANLKKIPADFFCCSYVALEQVYLYKNGIPALQGGALSRAENLIIFNANHNNIAIIDRQFFHNPASRLMEMHLGYNQIQSLPRDMFSGMTSLKLVDLSHNRMRYLPDNAWKPIWGSLSDVYLEGNPLECECNLDWLPMSERSLGDRERRSRFITGSCRQMNNVSVTSPLENLDFTDIVCSDLCRNATDPCHRA